MARRINNESKTKASLSTGRAAATPCARPPQAQWNHCTTPANVFRSLQHIYAQIIDDSHGHTLAAASSMDPAIREEGGEMKKVEAAKKVGTLVAERAKAAGITAVVFDRGGYKYHGRIKALADAAREAGLDF